MKIKQSTFFPFITCILTTALETNCAKNEPIENSKQYNIELNNLQNDEYCKNHSELEKIKIYRNFINNKDNFIVIDKKNCTSIVYNSQGDTLYMNEVLLGKSIGDKRSIDDKYTPPGEYLIVGSKKDYGVENKKLYSEKLFPIIGDIKPSGDKFLALHQIPNTEIELRLKNLYNGTLCDNRISNGCINYSNKDFDKMSSFIKGDNTNVYILPEEKDNFLKLEKSFWGTYKLKQVKF